MLKKHARALDLPFHWRTAPAGNSVPFLNLDPSAADVIILRREFERCERAWGLFDASGVDTSGKTSYQAKRPPRPGAPPKHDWDAFAGAIARRVHDHGMPVSHGELVRDMMDWFASREDFPPPDERTVRRKVWAIWKELVSSAP